MSTIKRQKEIEEAIGNFFVIKSVIFFRTTREKFIYVLKYELFSKYRCRSRIFELLESNESWIKANCRNKTAASQVCVYIISREAYSFGDKFPRTNRKPAESRRNEDVEGNSRIFPPISEIFPSICHRFASVKVIPSRACGR